MVTQASFFFFWLNDLNIYKDKSYKIKLVSATLNFMPKQKQGLWPNTHSFQSIHFRLARRLTTLV